MHSRPRSPRFADRAVADAAVDDDRLVELRQQLLDQRPDTGRLVEGGHDRRDAHRGASVVAHGRRIRGCVLLVGRGRCAVGFARVVARWSARPRHGQGPGRREREDAAVPAVRPADGSSAGRGVPGGRAEGRARGRPRAALLAPAEDVADLAARFPDTTVLAQRGTSLGAALHHAAETGAVLVAGDAPGIAPSVIAAARASSADLTARSVARRGLLRGPGPAVPSGGVHGRELVDAVGPRRDDGRGARGRADG